MQALLTREEKNERHVCGRPPDVVQLLASTMLDLLAEEPRSPMPPVAALTLQAATDAGANDTDATIGGWYSTHPAPAKHEVHWFYMDIDQTKHPWAYDRGSPKLRIAAIELYGTMILMKHIVSHSTDMSITLPMVTDNMGNAYAATSWKSKIWPNSLLLLELALTRHHHRMRTELKHVHRENNTWSDQLTHRNTDGFNPRFKMDIRPDSFHWYVLTKFKEFSKINEPP